MEQISIEEDYKNMTMPGGTIDSVKTEIEKALLCKQFADRHSLVFLGFDVKNGHPMFHDPSNKQSADSPLSELTVKELKELCKSAEIAVPRNANKEDLVTLLSK